MSLKAKVKQYLTKPPCNFAFERDDTRAVNNGMAVLQCKNDYTASLLCQMPADRADVVLFNTNTMVALGLLAGWQEVDAWLAECMRAGEQRQRESPFMTIRDGVRYELIINRGYQLATLTVTESTA